jgi:hypothetical protein
VNSALAQQNTAGAATENVANKKAILEPELF